MTSYFQQRDWTESNSAFVREMSKDITVGLTLFSKTTAYYGEGEKGQYYSPTVFLIQPRIETFYEAFQAQVKPIFPLATGTICISPIWTEIGSLPFYTKPIPRSAKYWIGEDSWNTANWIAYSSGFNPPYFFVDRADCELYPNIDSMLAHIENSVTWLQEKFSTTADILAMAQAASTDINKAILFGPDWCYRLPFILLLEDKKSEALAVRSLLKEISWTSQLMINNDEAESRMDRLFEWIERHREPYDTPKLEQFSSAQLLARLAALTELPKVEVAADRINPQLIPFTLGILGVHNGQDPNLMLTEPLSNTKSPVTGYKKRRQTAAMKQEQEENLLRQRLEAEQQKTNECLERLSKSTWVDSLLKRVQAAPGLDTKKALEFQVRFCAEVDSLNVEATFLYDESLALARVSFHRNEILWHFYLPSGFYSAIPGLLKSEGKAYQEFQNNLENLFENYPFEQLENQEASVSVLLVDGRAFFNGFGPHLQDEIHLVFGSRFAHSQFRKLADNSSLIGLFDETTSTQFASTVDCIVFITERGFNDLTMWHCASANWNSIKTLDPRKVSRQFPWSASHKFRPQLQN